MKRIRNSAFMALFVIAALAWGGSASGQISPGSSAPVFTLNDAKGEARDLSKAKDLPVVILYFFAADSRPSQEGLLSLNQLMKQYPGSGLTVWAVTRSSREAVTPFITQSGVALPVLLDQGQVSDLYQARMVLPTVCVIGPGLKVLDYFQGGGKTTEAMLVRVAERELQRKQTQTAKAIGEQVVKKNPQNVKAKAVTGYAALKEKKVSEAEKVFTDLARKGTPGEVVGKEGLAAVYAQKGEAAKALQVAKEAEEQAPKRAYAHVVKGDILYAEGKKKEAEAEYQAAARKEEVEVYQDAVRFNQLGRYYAAAGDYGKARDLYDRAVNIDPYY
ncbi:MAG TPA: redoxin domain-containing protein, partial [Thermodesulfobacteriota bacterium]|nr:redoxin domain-containing protein [Thermodesulfobacteriota bacterium]